MHKQSRLFLLNLYLQFLHQRQIFEVKHLRSNSRLMIRYAQVNVFQSYVNGLNKQLPQKGDLNTCTNNVDRHKKI